MSRQHGAVSRRIPLISFLGGRRMLVGVLLTAGLLVLLLLGHLGYVLFVSADYGIAIKRIETMLERATQLQHKHNLADDLEALARGALAPEQFRLRYATADSNPVASQLWGNLEHYLSDVDIRERDAEYREMQQGELSKLVRLLRQDAPLAQLREVHFLGVSSR